MTYKYGVSDTRNSQSIEIFNDLKKKYKKITAYDPFIKNNKFNNKTNLKDNDIYIFLSKGKKYKTIYKDLNNKKIIDPFYYYTS